MCNGFSTRTSQGGALAILRPLYAPANVDRGASISNNDQIKVTLQEERCPKGERTGAVSFSFSYNERKKDPQDCTIEIHADGDLVPSPARDSRPALHRVQIPSGASQTRFFDQNSKLRLVVGEGGVIGRRISMVDVQSGGRIAEGVIGWN